MRKSPLRSLFSHPGLALGGVFLAILGATGIAFSSWSTLQGARLEGIGAEFASVLDAREYVSGPRFTITPYCEDGFVLEGENDVLSASGQLFFSFELKNDAALREYAGEGGLPISLDVSCSEEFLASLARRNHCNTVEELYAAIGYGGLQMARILPKLKDGITIAFLASGVGDAFSSAASALDPAEGSPLSVSIFLGDRA